MNLFWLLLLAHLIGDFPLQTDRVFYYKNKKEWGIFVHIGLCTMSNAVLTIPYFVFPGYWGIFVALSVLHLIYDRTKIKLTSLGLSDNFPVFIADQFLHVSTVFFASIIFYHFYPNSDYVAAGPWANLPFIQLLSGFILIIFAIAPINYFLVNDYYHYVRKFDRPFWTFPMNSERIWGYTERGLIALAILSQGWWLVLIPVAVVPRFLFRQKNNLFDFSLSLLLTICIALAMYRFLHLGFTGI